jgi:hypothetical protein
VEAGATLGGASTAPRTKIGGGDDRWVLVGTEFVSVALSPVGVQRAQIPGPYATRAVAVCYYITQSEMPYLVSYQFKFL